ncbi:unnamed protein product, partial [Polarella glacialis]
NKPEEKIDADLLARLLAGLRSGWGKGLPVDPCPGVWRPYLFGFKDASENLQEIRGILGITSRPADQMSIEQITEGVRRILILKYSHHLLVSSSYWSESQARSIAKALAADCCLEHVAETGHGLEECIPMQFAAHLPWSTPRWVQMSQRLSIAALRPLFLNLCGWTSRRVETPSGLMHVYECPAQNPCDGAEPPLLLQHGMFVTGWSMALLGWLLSRRGRQVVIPELFDFDHGLSAS